MEQQVIPATGHTPVTDPAVPATCTEAGKTEGSHCSVCGEVLEEQQVIPATGHTPVTDPAVPATYTETGLTEGSHCSVCGAVLVEQEIVPKLEPTPKIELSQCTLTVEDQTYTGKALKPKVTVKYGDETLKKGTDYTVSFKNNKAVGTATATVEGMGSFTGTKNVTFKINPKGTAFTKLTGGKQQITLKWKNPKNITGYQIQYSLEKNFKRSKTVKVKKAKTLTTTIKKLKANKKYYVRIRSYATVARKTYYSAWSKVKTVKTKGSSANNEAEVVGKMEEDIEATLDLDGLSFDIDETYDEVDIADSEIELQAELP